MSRRAEEGDRKIALSRIKWRGIAIEVSYEADWLNMAKNGEARVAHLQIESVAPERAPLPITETGYRSFFGSADAIEAVGGPDAYALAWLNYEATDPAWIKRETERRQLSLF